MSWITLESLAVVFALIVAAAIVRAHVTRLVALPHEAVLVHRNGRDLGRLAPGTSSAARTRT
jgi:hypothetical protein